MHKKWLKTSPKDAIKLTKFVHIAQIDTNKIRISSGGEILKIENKENINEILLSHKGRNVKFECFIKPFPYSDRLDLAEKKPVEIVFDDLMEVEALIDMLKRFKQEIQEYIGVWKRW